MQKSKPWFRKSKNAWYAQVGGRQIRLGDTKDQANECLRLLTNGRTGKPVLVRVDEVCNEFLEWASKNSSPETYEWRLRFLQDFCDHWGSLKVWHLEPLHVTKWLDGRKKWSQSTRRAAIASVKRAFNWATDEGYIASNPVRKVQKPPIERREVILAVGHNDAMVNAARGPKYKELLLALHETGCRPGEIAKVTAADVNLDAGTWSLQDHKTRRFPLRRE